MIVADERELRDLIEHTPTGTSSLAAQQQGEQGHLTPEFLDWARQHLNEDEVLAELREIQETGGCELADFIQEMEQKAAARE